MTRSPIPTHWSPEPALAVYEYLQQLSEQIWEHYHGPLIDLIGPCTEELLPPHSRPMSPEQIEWFEINDTPATDFNDDWPF